MYFYWFGICIIIYLFLYFLGDFISEKVKSIMPSIICYYSCYGHQVDGLTCNQGNDDHIFHKTRLCIAILGYPFFCIFCLVSEASVTLLRCRYRKAKTECRLPSSVYHVLELKESYNIKIINYFVNFKHSVCKNI